MRRGRPAYPDVLTPREWEVCPLFLPHPPAPTYAESVTEPEDRFYEASRLRLHYVVWGDESKPALLLVHGGRDHARSWDFVAQRLLDRFAVYAPDLRGHGDSDWAQGGAYQLADYVADLACLVDVIGRPVSIVGHSLGGRVVLNYAAAFADRVRALVCIEGFGRLGPDAPASARLRGYVRNIREMETRRVHAYATLEAAAARMQEANHRLSPAMVRHLTEHAVRRREDGTYVWKFDNYVRLNGPTAWTAEEATALWRGIRARVLLVGGAESWLSRLPVRPASKQEIEGLAASIPGAQSVVVEDAGHWVHHDQFERFVALLREFLSD